MDNEKSSCPVCGHEVVHAQDKTVYSRFVVIGRSIHLTSDDGEMPDDAFRIVCMNCMTTWDCLEDYLSALDPRVPVVLYDKVEKPEHS